MERRCHIQASVLKSPNPSKHKELRESNKRENTKVKNMATYRNRSHWTISNKSLKNRRRGKWRALRIRR